jgi:hypothetical protein
MVGMLGCYVIRRSRGCHRVTDTQGPQLGRLDLGRDVFRLVAFLMVPVVVGHGALGALVVHRKLREHEVVLEKP